MSLSDCPKCWDTPCTCGESYRDWSAERLRGHIQMLNKVLETLEEHGSRPQGITRLPKCKVVLPPDRKVGSEPDPSEKEK